MLYRRRPSERSGVWHLYAPMLWLFLTSAVLGIIAWSTYLRNIVDIVDSALTPTPFLSSPVIKDAFLQLYPVVLITSVFAPAYLTDCLLTSRASRYSLHFASGTFGMLFVLHRFVSVVVEPLHSPPYCSM
jgi:hypothetical protein